MKKTVKGSPLLLKKENTRNGKKSNNPDLILFFIPGIKNRCINEIVDTVAIKVIVSKIPQEFVLETYPKIQKTNIRPTTFIRILQKLKAFLIII